MLPQSRIGFGDRSVLCQNSGNPVITVFGQIHAVLLVKNDPRGSPIHTELVSSISDNLHLTSISLIDADTLTEHCKASNPKNADIFPNIPRF